MHLNNIEYQRSIKAFNRYYTPDTSRTSSTSFTPFVVRPVLWSCTKRRHYLLRAWVICTNWRITTDMDEVHKVMQKIVFLDTSRVLFEENLCNIRPTQNICPLHRDEFTRLTSCWSMSLRQMATYKTILTSWLCGGRQIKFKVTKWLRRSPQVEYEVTLYFALPTFLLTK